MESNIESINTSKTSEVEDYILFLSIMRDVRYTSLYLSRYSVEGILQYLRKKSSKIRNSSYAYTRYIKMQLYILIELAWTQMKEEKRDPQCSGKIFFFSPAHNMRAQTLAQGLTTIIIDNCTKEENE